MVFRQPGDQQTKRWSEPEKENKELLVIND